MAQKDPWGLRLISKLMKKLLLPSPQDNAGQWRAQLPTAAAELGATPAGVARYGQGPCPSQEVRDVQVPET